MNRIQSSSPTAWTRRLAVPYLGVIAGLQWIDPVVASMVLLKAANSLHMKGAMLPLAASISTLALAATVLATGYLADRLGRRRVLIASLWLVVFSNVLCAFAPSSGLFLFGRVLAGIGIGAFYSASFAYVKVVVEPGELAASLGIWNLIQIIFVLFGALLGGLLADISWRLAMLLVPLLGSLCAVLAPLLLPPMRANTKLLVDIPGLLSIALAMVLFLFGVSHVVDGFSDTLFLLPTLFGLALFAFHYWLERSHTSPIFPVSLYARGFFGAAIVSGIAWNFAYAVVHLQTSNFWQVVQGFSPASVAAGHLPLLICFGVGGVVAGRLLKPGQSLIWLIASGFVFLVIGLLSMSGIQASTGYVQFVPALVLVGLGMAFVTVPQSTLFVVEAPDDFYGSVTAFRTTIGQLGFGLGLAASGAFVKEFGLDSLSQHREDLGWDYLQVPFIATEKVRAFLEQGEIMGGSNQAQVIELLRRAYASGLWETMVVAAVVTLVLGCITLWLLRRGQQQITSEWNP